MNEFKGIYLDFYANIVTKIKLKRRKKLYMIKANKILVLAKF